MAKLNYFFAYLSNMENIFKVERWKSLLMKVWKVRKNKWQGIAGRRATIQLSVANALQY
ncbi:hypothetical protein [Proteiniphilum saccharofermentans]|uniref:hypothetical protein n=1 Tax=Proteiniphilum saccharofermentans TaxID=1642647 RepID=UPI0012B6198A|nr:hypothetical protein [Proteiniphilum saccharofermentans]